ncbi:MAG: T9SS type A sorting domain-containing protein, partial [Bacteroidales bacterium]|nr:T9SS type A sorting domain-containing protein [Bacteroidales bacterium]
NPVSDVSNLDINLSETADIQISLFNISGQLIREHFQTAYTGRNTVKINVSGLLQGIYFLKIKDNNNKEVIRKFIKQE